MGFSSCSQHSLRSLLATVSSTRVQRTELCSDLWGNPIFKPQKINYCFLLPLLNTYIYICICVCMAYMCVYTRTHTYLWFDMIKNNPWLWCYSQCSPNWIFPKDLFFVKCHSNAARRLESFMRVVLFSTQLAYGVWTILQNVYRLEVKAFNYSFCSQSEFLGLRPRFLSQCGHV